MRNITILFFIFLTCSQVLAGYQIIILTGAPTRVAVEKSLAELMKRSDSISYAKSYPKILESSQVKGLNPGFWLAVAGYCSDDSASAGLFLSANIARIKKMISGSYAKSIKGIADDKTCPLLEKNMSLESKELLSRLLDKAVSYKNDGDLKSAKYLTDYCLARDPKNKRALDLDEVLMTLTTE
jgi:hypothetical protein